MRAFGKCAWRFQLSRLVTICVVTFLAGTAPTHADAIYGKARPLRFDRTDAAYVARNHVLRDLVAKDAELARQILDVLKAERDPPPDSAIDPDDNPDLIVRGRHSEWNELLRQALVDLGLIPQEFRVRRSRSAEGSVELIEMLKKAKKAKGANGQ